jgi:hypothetical protein
VPVASPVASTATDSWRGVVPLVGETLSQGASSVTENAAAEPSLIESATSCAGAVPPGSTPNPSDAGEAASEGPVLATRKLLVTTCVSPAVRSMAAVMLCCPSAIVVVSNGSAVPFAAVPAKSHGALPSDLRGVPVLLGSSR